MLWIVNDLSTIAKHDLDFAQFFCIFVVQKVGDIRKQDVPYYFLSTF